MLEMMLAGKKKGRNMLIVDGNNDLHLVNLLTLETKWTATVSSSMTLQGVAMTDDGYTAMAGTGGDFYIVNPGGAGGRWFDLPAGLDAVKVIPWGPGEVILAGIYGATVIHLESGATRTIDHSLGYTSSPRIFKATDGIFYIAGSGSSINIMRLGHDEVFSQTAAQYDSSAICGVVETAGGLRFLDRNSYVRDEMGNSLFRASRYYGPITLYHQNTVSVLGHSILAVQPGNAVVIARTDEPELSARLNSSSVSAIAADSDGNLYSGHSSTGGSITCMDLELNVLWSEQVLPNGSTKKLVILE